MDIKATMEYIQKTIDGGDPSTLKNLMQSLEGSKVITQQSIMRIWYGLTPLKRCSSEALTELAGALGAPLAQGQEDVKALFMADQTPSMQKVLVSFLNSCRPYENQFGCDLAVMSREQIFEMFDGFAFYNRTTCRKYVSHLGIYVKWHQDNGRPYNSFWDADPIKLDDIDLTAGMRKHCIGSPEQLYDILSRELPLNEGYVAPVAAAMAWAGLSLQEIIEVRNEDVSEDGKFVCGLEVPDVLAPILQHYRTVTEVVRTCAVEKTLIADDVGYFLKRLVSKPEGKRVTKFGVGNAMAAVDIPNLSSILASSRYYSLYQKELAGQGRLTPEDIRSTFKMFKAATTMHLEDRLVEFMNFKAVFYNT